MSRALARVGLLPQKKNTSKIIHTNILHTEYAVAQLIEALCSKPEGRGFDSRQGSLIFFIGLILPALGPTQPLTEMSTRNISWG
jgi:hypothetical protein